MAKTITIKMETSQKNNDEKRTRTSAEKNKTIFIPMQTESEQKKRNIGNADKQSNSNALPYTIELARLSTQQTEDERKNTYSEEKEEEKSEPRHVTNNILFEQWKAATEKRNAEEKAQQERGKLQKRLKELNQNAAYSSTTAASDEYEQERKSLLEQLHALDETEGREARTYDGRERAGAFFGSWGKGTGASYTNAAANIVDLSNEVGGSAKAAERELADLEAQLARAQTAYDETVREYGESSAAATFEKNLLTDAQQKLDAKKALYASTAERDRAAYEKTKATAGNMYDVADKLLTQSEEDMARAKVGTSALGSFALDAAKTGLDIGLDTAASALGVPGLANMAARVYGSEAQQARLQGDDAQTAAAKGLKSALIEVATEKIAGPFEKAYGKTALSSSINKAVDKLNASGLLKWAADTAGEGFEEGMSDVLNTVADHIMGWDSGENTVWGDIAADKDEILYDMLLGAFVGAFGSAGNIVGNKATAAPAVQTAPVQQNTAQPQMNYAQFMADEQNAPSQLNIDNGNARVYNNTSDNSANNIGGMTDVAGRSVEADSGRVSGVYRGRDTVHRGEKKSPGVGVGSGLVLLSPQARDTLAKRGVAVVETQDVSNDKPAFSAALDAARNSDTVNGWAVTPKSVADLEESGAKLVMSANGSTGLAITPDGDIEAVFANKAAGAPKGATKTTIPQAIANGGTKLDCYGEGLVTLYAKYGFVPVARVKFNPEYANPGWDASKGTPDIFFMMHSGDSADTVVQKMGTYHRYTESELNALPVMDYDEAYSYRDSLLANRATTPVAATQPTGDISTPPTAQNVKQGDSDALNSAVNYNSREAQTAAPTQVQQNTASTQEMEKKWLSMADYADKNSGVWNNLDYNDTAAQIKAMHEAHERMTAEGRVVEIPESTQKKTAESFPDLRGMKKSERTPILKQKMADLKSDIRQFLNGLKGGSFEFEVNGNVLEAKLYDTGIKEVLEKITQDKANMLNHSDLIFDNAEYLYSLPDYDGNPNVYRWNYFYTPVQIGDSIVGVRIALRDMKQTDSGKPESQIYNWGIKKTPALDGGSPEKTSLSTGVSSAGVIDTTSERYAAEKDGFSQADVMSVSDDISSNNSIRNPTQNVKQNFAGNGLYYRSKLGTGEGTRTTQTVETINNADMTTDARREQINPYVKNGRFDYVPDTNKAQMERATEKIKKDGWAKTVADFRADVARGKSSADLVALGAVLLNNAGNSEASVTEYMDIYADYAELLSRTAGALQVGRLANQLTPAGQLYGMERVVDRLNEEYKATKLYAKYADIKIDKKLKSDFLRAKDEAARNKCIDAIQQNIADQMPTTFNEAFTAFRYTAMLGNFKTQERNVLGNTMSLASKIVKDRLAAAIEGAGHFFSGGKMEKTRSVWAGGALYKEAYNDFKAHEAEALGESKYTSIARKTAKEIEDKRTIFKINGDWGKTADSNNAKKLARKAADVSMATLEGWRKATNWTMEMGDAVFSRVAYADAMAGWLKAHKINSFSEATESQLDRARAFAIKEAQEATFRDTNAISELAVSLDSGLKTSQNPVARGLGKVTEGIVPFRKTPANVAVRAVEYSPLGTLETAYKVWQAVNGKANAADVINAASKTLTGTGLFLAGIALKQAGKLRGKEDDEELDKAQKATGAMDYSYITDKGDYVSLSQFAPMAIPLFMGVRFAELTEDGFDPKDVWAIALGTTDPMLEMSMLQGLNDSLDGISDYGSEQGALGQFLTNALESYISQYVPSVVRHIEQATEEYRQSTYTDKNNPYLSTNAQYWLGKQSAGIPGVDYQQEDYIDMWGRKTNQGEAVERVLNSFFNPVYTSKGKREPLDDELERLYKAGKNIDGFPSVYPDSGSFYQDLDGNGKQMTREQFNHYRISRGTLSRSLARDFVDSEEYKYLNDMERAEVLSDLYKFAADTALRNAKNANGIYSEPDTTYKGISNDDIPEYLATKQVLSDAKNGKTTDWSGVDALLANIKSYSPEVQEKLQTSSGLNVNKLLYADNLGIDSKAWYKAHNAVAKNVVATDSSKDWVTAEAINKLGGSNEDKLEMLSATVTPDGSNYNRVRGGYTRPSIVRRFDAAINSGVDFDVWTDVEKLVEQLQNGNSSGWGCSTSFITQALADNGYTKEEIDDVWAIKKASGDYEGVNYLDDYWQQLIDNAGRAAAGKTVKVG